MRILYITFENLSLHKGSVVHVRETIAGLRKRGHEVGLMGRASEPFMGADAFYNLEPRKILVKSTARSKILLYLVSSFLLFWSLIKVLHRYEVIYARDFHTVMVALIPSLLARRNMVFEVNGLASEEQKLRCGPGSGRIFGLLLKKAEKWAAKSADRIVAVTPQIASYFGQDLHRQPGKVKVVSNGVNIKRFYPIDNEKLLLHWKTRLGITEGDRVVAFVGNLAPWQGLNTLIDSAFHILSREEKLKFLIVGDGLLKGDLVRKVLDSGFEKQFIFTGMVDYEDVPFLINIADICVAPFILQRNKMTGLSPLKIFEYMACGKPIVSSRIEGLEFIESEKAGYLTEPDDPIGLEEALSDLIKDPERRRCMGRTGLQIVREKFDWESKVVEIERILCELA
jgi:glycosyltransferase involved in cell wall biosynthesis